MAIDTDLSKLQTRINDAQSRKARAEIEKENATEALENTKARLKEEFGVTTKDQIAVLLNELEEQYKKAIAEVEEALEGAGA